MRILSAAQHRALDQATITRDGISSAKLMERAATALTERFIQHYPDSARPVCILSGSGNNGGDGLVLARQLRQRAYSVRVILAEISEPSEDNRLNRRRAKEAGVGLQRLQADVSLGALHDVISLVPGEILVDALFGTGLSRPIEGYWAGLIDFINTQPVERVAVDLPSGLQADRPSTGSILRATLTLSLGYPKLALFSPANTVYLGKWELVPFELADEYGQNLSGPGHHLLTDFEVSRYLRPRRANDHKGTFGHALLVGGSYGKIGAALISARAILRSGAGLVTTHIPRCGYDIMQAGFPEAMCITDDERDYVSNIGPTEHYTSIGIGPGLGTEVSTRQALYRLLGQYHKSMVIDADAINILALEPTWLTRVPAQSIFTPHPKEFERLCGKTTDDFTRWERQLDMAKQLNGVLLLKTGYTSIATPDGDLYFNPTGNPGMGTAGTGDALTGILTGLLAQGYPPAVAARIGVYLHGLAGDLAAAAISPESMLAEDLVNYLGQAYKALRA